MSQLTGKNFEGVQIERRLVGKGLAHDSALKHVSGAAAYIDDLPELPGTLHAAFILSPVAHGKLNGVDLSEALASKGVAAAVLASDIPGHNDIGPILKHELLFAEFIVDYRGAIIGAIAADTMANAIKAAKKVKLDIAPLQPVLDVESAHQLGLYVQPPQTASRLLGAKTTSISKLILPTRFPVKTMRCWCTLPPSIRLKCSTMWRACWVFRPAKWSAKSGAWAAGSAARKASPPTLPPLLRCWP
jgi:xanthine dehydrogenase molybdopterin-binding subunit B